MTDNTVLELTADSPDVVDEVYDGLRGMPGITVVAAPAPRSQASRASPWTYSL